MQPKGTNSFSPSVSVRRRAIVCLIQWGGWGVIALALMVGSACWLDRPLAIFLHQNVSLRVDQFFQHIGILGNGGIYASAALTGYAATLYAALHHPTRSVLSQYVRGSLLLLATLSVAGLVTFLLKRIVARARPDLFFTEGYYGVGSPFSGKPFDSFPSSHTLAAFVVAAVMGRMYPAWRWPAMIIALMVALSRLVNLDHYLSDVMAAALIAIATVYGLAPCICDESQTWPLRAPWQWFKRG